MKHAFSKNVRSRTAIVYRQSKIYFSCAPRFDIHLFPVIYETIMIANR